MHLRSSISPKLVGASLVLVFAGTGCLEAPTAATEAAMPPVSASVVGASSPTLVTDPAVFTAAVADQELRQEDFDTDETGFNYLERIGMTSLTLRGLNVTGASFDIQPDDLFGSDPKILARGAIRFTFPTPTTAASVRFGNLYLNAVRLLVTLSTGETVTTNVGDLAEGFVGVHSPAPFSYIDLIVVDPTQPELGPRAMFYDDLSWVGNAPPTVTGAMVSGSPARLLHDGAEVTISGVTFSDPGGAEDGPFTTTIDCGNGTQATAAGLCRYTAVGAYLVFVTVTDREGATSKPLVRRVEVQYNWSGFFSPVHNLPTRNLVRAGRAVPVKFSLNGNQGMEIFSVEPRSRGMVCSGPLNIEDRATTVTPGNSSLQYDAATDQYTYVWATDPAWAGSCRELRVFLADGTERVAHFEFRR